MKSSTVIVDYGVGNLHSVSMAVEACGHNSVLTSDLRVIINADHVVLPGVGAFGRCIDALRERGLVEPLFEYMQSGRSLLGICVGMQMLMKYSEEFGRHEGFGLIPGHVGALPPTRADGSPHKIPRVGWEPLVQPEEGRWKGTILDGVAPGSACYFVHSFAAVPERPEDILAVCDYNGRTVCAAVRCKNVYGVQFHPEKSGPVGLSILSAFLNGTAGAMADEARRS